MDIPTCCCLTCFHIKTLPYGRKRNIFFEKFNSICSQENQAKNVLKITMQMEYDSLRREKKGVKKRKITIK